MSIEALGELPELELECNIVVTDAQIHRAQNRCKYKWTRQELQNIKKRYLAKESMDNIAESLQISEISIARVLRIMEVTSRSRGKVPSLDAAQKVQALILLEKHTQQEVADKFGVSRWAVQRAFAAHRSVSRG